MIELDRYSTTLPDVNGYRWIPLYKNRILPYNYCISKSGTFNALSSLTYWGWAHLDGGWVDCDKSY